MWEITDHANFWVRTDGATSTLSFYDGWPNYIRTDTDWVRIELLVYVPEDAVIILFGAILVGEDKMWMDNLRLDVSDAPEFD